MELKPTQPSVTMEELNERLDSMENEIACELSTYEHTTINGHFVEVIQMYDTHNRRTGMWLIDSVPTPYPQIAKKLGVEE